MKNIRKIEKLKYLETLLINGCTNIENMNEIEKRKNLKEIYLSRLDKKESKDFEFLNKNEQLTIIDLYQNKSFVDDNFIFTKISVKKNLQEIFLSNCKKISDSSLVFLSSHHTSLQSVYLNKLSNLSFYGLSLLFQNCKYLQKVAIEGFF